MTKSNINSIHLPTLNNKRHPIIFHDENGDYKYLDNDHIGYRYEVLKFLGKGSFGTALKCIDHKTGREIALKVVKNK